MNDNNINNQNEPNNQNVQTNFFGEPIYNNVNQIPVSNNQNVENQMNSQPNNMDQINNQMNGQQVNMGQMNNMGMHNNNQTFPSMQQPNNGPQISFERSENDYVRDYIGNNSEKLMNRPFNFSAFFFSYAYFFYRKQFLLGIIAMAIYLGVPYFAVKQNLDFNIWFIGTSVISGIVFGLLFNKLYTNKARNAVKKIMMGNNGLDQFSISGVLQKKGGTSFVFFLVASLLYGFLFNYLGLTEKLNMNGMTMNYSNGDITVSGDATMVIHNTDVNLNNTFNVTIPNGYKPGVMSNDNSYDYSLSIGNDGKICTDEFNCNSCDFSLYAVKGWTSASEFSKARASAFSTTTNLINQNNIQMFNFKYEFINHNNEYVFEKDGIIYYLSFEDSSDNSACSIYENQILNSLSFK